jgi:hypothetical protein
MHIEDTAWLRFVRCRLRPSRGRWPRRNFLRVEHDDDDAVISALIAAARSHIEALTRLMLLTQTWRRVGDAWPADGRLGSGHCAR